jgi:outer membrane receptor protein involved in Fe transport
VSLAHGQTAPDTEKLQEVTVTGSRTIRNALDMGFTRTLILFDGKRVPPTSHDGTVDVNMIPQMLLHRVDVVTGGASAIYGSDAVTGVVSFVLDKHFNGLMVNAFSGISHDRDDKINDQGIAWGTDLFDRQGHFEASFQNHDDPDVLLRSQRAWGREVWTVQGGGGTPANPVPYHLVNNTRIAGSSPGRRFNFSGGSAMATVHAHAPFAV